EDAVHGGDDGHLDSFPRGERVGTACRGDAFGDGLLPRDGFGECRTASDVDADGAIAAERAGAGQYEIAETGETGEGGGLRAECDTESRHLGEAARDERGARVVTEPEPVDHSCRDGHDVL